MKIAIVGAGISGLATGYALLARQPGLELVILEAAQRSGGKVWTDRSSEGYACEWGVNGFLNNKPKTLELAAHLELDALQGFEAANRRFVYRRGALHQLPESPSAFLRSGLMSLRGRLRVLWEPFVRRGLVQDETLAAFAERRLGLEAFDALIDPMASGVFAGDPHQMSLKSCFPRMHEIELEYGSLVRGMIRLQRKARREGKGKGPGPGPGGKLMSFAQGMSEMTDRLASKLGSRIRLNAAVERISRCGDRYELGLDGDVEEADLVILAAPAYAQADMLRELAPDISGLLHAIEYPPLSIVCLGYREEDLGDALTGFGFLVPSKERRAILGTILDSNVFPNRAPEGAMLMRSMVGGARTPELAGLADRELTDLVQYELKAVMGIDASPGFARIYRHKKAIPQYHVGYAARLRAISEALERHPGLVLTGNAFRGVSLNDCIENAWRTAEKLLPKMGSGTINYGID